VSVPGTKYALGSVLNHVLLHQTVIGLEAKKQFEKIGEYPDMMFAPCGGGCNFAGATFPFLGDAAADDARAQKICFVAVEPSSCLTLTICV
jgi:predicted alternative tryptophan synthase beta-subunit